MSILLMIYLVFGCNISLIHGWNLPPANFFEDFAIAHGCAMIIIYLPEDYSGKLIKWHKNSFSQ